MSSENKEVVTGPTKVAENIWRMEYPLSLLGDEHGRVVTIIRLTSGKLIIHSSAPFSSADVDAIHALGEPGWLVDVNLLHDTFAKEGHKAFPGIPYLAPDGFAAECGVNFRPLFPIPSEWQREIKVALVEGMPRLREHLFLHVPSRTLVVGDLVQNYDEKETAYQWVLHHVAMGLHQHPDVNRLVVAMVSDKPAFAACIGLVMTWDFDRLIIGHRVMIETGAKAAFRAAIARAFPELQTSSA